MGGIKQGYKKTVVGVIPEDWRIATLASISEKIMVGIASAATHAYRERGIPMLRNQNIKPGYLDDDEILFLDPEYELTYKNKRLKAGDLLTARTGYPGTTCIIPAKYENAQSFTTLITRPNLAIALSEYLTYYINSEIGQRFVEQNKIGGGQKNIGVGILQIMPIALPPTLVEQRAIADALSEIDSQITTLDELIAKKRELKQGAMQKLLTGEERLEGFGEEWELKQLWEIGAFKKGRNIPKQAITIEGVPCVLYGEIYTKYNNFSTRLESHIPQYIANDSVEIKSGDVLFAGSGETLEEIGKCFAYVGLEQAYAGGDIIIFSPYKSDGVFLGYLLNTAPVQQLKSNIGQGSSVMHIYVNNLSKISIRIPQEDEQRAIAKIISEMDAEITELEEKREKVVTIKQGMMQELLTGRTRLI